MTLRQIELFTLVYELRNLTRTAELLYMTQSAVTQNLKKMEEELGVSLFERSGRQLIPSQGGDSFYRHAKRILEEYRSSLSELSVIGEHLSFYYYAMPSSAIKDRVLASFWKLDPFLQVEHRDCRFFELLDNTRWTPGALYLVPEEFIHDPEIRSVEAAEVQHYIIMRDNHRLRGRSVIYPEDLAGETLLLRSDRGKQFPHLNAALEQLRERGIPYQTAIAERAPELIPKILSFGGLAIVPEYLTSEVPGILSKPYEDGIGIHVRLAYKGELSPRVKKLLERYQAEAAVSAEEKKAAAR